jgi:hypothetical protein
MNISPTNIKLHLTTLTPTQLNKELVRVEGQYEGAQISALTEDQL